MKAKNTLNIPAEADGITQKANPKKANPAKTDHITLKAKNTSNILAKAGDGADVENGFLDVQDLARLNQGSWSTYKIAFALTGVTLKTKDTLTTTLKAKHIL